MSDKQENQNRLTYAEATALYGNLKRQIAMGIDEGAGETIMKFDAWAAGFKMKFYKMEIGTWGIREMSSEELAVYTAAQEAAQQ